MSRRISDVNRKRKVRYTQALLLGCQLQQRHQVAPGGKIDVDWLGYLPAGDPIAPCPRRYQAVDALLWELGVGP